MENATQFGSASNVVQMPPRPARRASTKPAPHFITFRDDRMHLDSQIDDLWQEATPLLARILAELPHTLDEARCSVDAMLLLPMAIFNTEGLITAAAFVHQGELPSGASVVYALIEPDGNWPDLSQFLSYLEDLAWQQHKDCLVLWSPSPLPPLEGWHEIAIPGQENLRGLFRSIDGGE